MCIPARRTAATSASTTSMLCRAPVGPASRSLATAGPSCSASSIPVWPSGWWPRADRRGSGNGGDAADHLRAQLPERVLRRFLQLLPVAHAGDRLRVPGDGPVPDELPLPLQRTVQRQAGVVPAGVGAAVAFLEAQPGRRRQEVRGAAALRAHVLV